MSTTLGDELKDAGERVVDRAADRFTKRVGNRLARLAGKVTSGILLSAVETFIRLGWLVVAAVVAFTYASNSAHDTHQDQRLDALEDAVGR